MKKTLLSLVGVVILFMCCSNDNKIIPDPGWDDKNENAVTRLKVATYNIHYGYPVGATSPNLKATADVIKSINPDVLLLQEVDINTGRSGGVNQLETIASLAGMEYYYFGKGIDFSNGEFGVAILSKYKLENTHSTLLPLLPKQNETDYIEQRVLADATITVNGHTLTIASTHLDLTQYNREAQVPAIHTQLTKNSYPVILGGDFNARPTNPIITEFQNLSYTFTNLSGYSISNILIDYITYCPAEEFKLISHKVVTTAVNVSDHYPVVAVFELK